MNYGTQVIISTTQFYEGYSRACEWGETDSVEYELKFNPELDAWLRRHGSRDGWTFEGVEDHYEHHWHAYDDAKAGKPVALKFWFGDPNIAVMFKLTWCGK